MTASGHLRLAFEDKKQILSIDRTELTIVRALNFSLSFSIEETKRSLSYIKFLSIVQ